MHNIHPHKAFPISSGVLTLGSDSTLPRTWRVDLWGMVAKGETHVNFSGDIVSSNGVDVLRDFIADQQERPFRLYPGTAYPVYVRFAQLPEIPTMFPAAFSIELVEVPK